MTRRALIGALAAVVMLATAPPVAAEHNAPWVVPLIEERASAHGVSASYMIRVARCESSLNPGAVGDHGSSHGLYQLNDYRTGLIWHFYRQGYESAYSAWEASDYFARVAAGEFAGEGVTTRRWTCG